MKTKFFTLLVLTLLFAACSKDETNLATQDEANLITTIAVKEKTSPQTTRSNSNLACAQEARTDCENYIPRVTHPFSPGTTLNISYNSKLTLEEIACIRKAYFECFDYIYMCIIQSSDPYQDTWVIIVNETGGAGSVARTVDEDDRLSGD